MSPSDCSLAPRQFGFEQSGQYSTESSDPSTGTMIVVRSEEPQRGQRRSRSRVIAITCSTTTHSRRGGGRHLRPKVLNLLWVFRPISKIGRACVGKECRSRWSTSDYKKH